MAGGGCFQGREYADGTAELRHAGRRQNGFEQQGKPKKRVGSEEDIGASLRARRGKLSKDIGEFTGAERISEFARAEYAGSEEDIGIFTGAEDSESEERVGVSARAGYARPA